MNDIMPIDAMSIYIAITMMATIVYATRVGGYFLGQQLRHIANIQPVLEVLPGCAFMALLVPAIRQGNMVEIISIAIVFAIMWRTNNVAVATSCGLLFLLYGEPLTRV